MILLTRQSPDIELKPTGHTIATYTTYFIKPFIYKTRIRLDWRKTRDQFRLNDHDLTIKAINEEMLHWVLHKTISEHVCEDWDNLPRETRIFLQN